MTRFDAHSAYVSAHAIGVFAHLNRLDDAWTLYLRERGKISSEQAGALAQITDEMRDMLARTGDSATRLQEFIERHQTDFDNTFQLIARSTLVAAELEARQCDELVQVVQAEGGFATFAIRQLAVICELNQTEADSLKAKMERIRKDGVTAGDLGHRFKCALLVALLAATIAGMMSTGTALLPPIVAAINGGAPACSIVSMFFAHHGGTFILEATHAVVGLAHSGENCFPRKS